MEDKKKSFLNYKTLFKKRYAILILLLFILYLGVHLKTPAEVSHLEGGIEAQEPTLLESNVIKQSYRNLDVAVVRVAFYYHPDADVTYEILKQEGQKQYPHLLGYKEMDGLYRKALATSLSAEELSQWRIQGGPSPYYIKAGAHIKNNGGAAMTDVKLTFIFDVNTNILKANSGSLTTDYNDLKKNSKWQHWTTQTVVLDVLPPGEDKLIQTESISVCSMLDKLNKKWPHNVRVRVQVSAPADTKRSNNSGAKVIKMIPDHFVLRTLR